MHALAFDAVVEHLPDGTRALVSTALAGRLGLTPRELALAFQRHHGLGLAVGTRFENEEIELEFASLGDVAMFVICAARERAAAGRRLESYVKKHAVRTFVRAL
jgi:hypothetical protein